VARAVAHGRHLAALGPSRLARLKLVWAAVWLPVRRRLGHPRGRPISLALARDSERFGMTVREVADLATVGEVLLDDLYEVPGLDDVRVIVDIGSHIGTSIVFFRLHHPEARIYGFEPDPRSFATLRANVGELPGVTIDQRAVSGASGAATFYSSENSLASSLMTDAGARRAVAVDTVSLDDLMDDLGLDRIDLLKLDVEGAEYEVLARTTRLDSVRAIAGELHPALIPCTPDEFFALLGDFEVKVDEFSGASWQFKAVRT
jgi:FkbM family methyltransferase